MLSCSARSRYTRCPRLQPPPPPSPFLPGICNVRTCSHALPAAPCLRSPFRHERAAPAAAHRPRLIIITCFTGVVFRISARHLRRRRHHHIARMHQGLACQTLPPFSCCDFVCVTSCSRGVWSLLAMCRPRSSFVRSLQLSLYRILTIIHLPLHAILPMHSLHFPALFRHVAASSQAQRCPRN